jgi:hypothetical protein
MCQSKILNLMRFLNMKVITKQYNCLKISVVIAATLMLPAQTFAEAGAKSMFADDTSSVMMSDDSASPAQNSSALKSKPKAVPVLAKKSHAADDSDYVENVASESDMLPTSYSGVQYWIDLQEPNGRTHKVTTSHIFHSGDGIKLQIKSKTAGYLYVMNQDSSGQVTPLYPPQGQSPAMIQANMTYTIPSRGAIRFDNVPGNEKVTIALAKYPIPSASNSAPSASVAGMTSVSYSGDAYNDCAGNHSSAGSKGMFAEESGGSSSMDCIRKNHNAGSKGMFSEEDSASVEPASYSVVPTAALEAGDVLFVDFNLSHR